MTSDQLSLSTEVLATERPIDLYGCVCILVCNTIATSVRFVPATRWPIGSITAIQFERPAPPLNDRLWHPIQLFEALIIYLEHFAEDPMPYTGLSN